MFAQFTWSAILKVPTVNWAPNQLVHSQSTRTPPPPTNWQWHPPRVYRIFSTNNSPPNIFYQKISSKYFPPLFHQNSPKNVSKFKIRCLHSLLGLVSLKFSLVDAFGKFASVHPAFRNFMHIAYTHSFAVTVLSQQFFPSKTFESSHLLLLISIFCLCHHPEDSIWQFNII